MSENGEVDKIQLEEDIKAFLHTELYVGSTKAWILTPASQQIQQPCNWKEQFLSFENVAEVLQSAKNNLRSTGPVPISLVRTPADISLSIFQM